eukprot:257963_1
MRWFNPDCIAFVDLRILSGNYVVFFIQIIKPFKSHRSRSNCSEWAHHSDYQKQMSNFSVRVFSDQRAQQKARLCILKRISMAVLSYSERMHSVSTAKSLPCVQGYTLVHVYNYLKLRSTENIKRLDDGSVTLS